MACGCEGECEKYGDATGGWRHHRRAWEAVDAGGGDRKEREREEKKERKKERAHRGVVSVGASWLCREGEEKEAKKEKEGKKKKVEEERWKLECSGERKKKKEAHVGTGIALPTMRDLRHHLAGCHGTPP